MAGLYLAPPPSPKKIVLLMNFRSQSDFITYEANGTVAPRPDVPTHPFLRSSPKSDTALCGL